MIYLKTYESFNQEDILNTIYESNGFNVGKVLPDHDEVVNDIKDLLLPVNDDGFYTLVEYENYPDVGLAKRKDGWKSMTGTYVSVYIAKSKKQNKKFRFDNTMFETYLDINSYIEDRFGVSEDGYHIEYYFETSNIKEKIPHYWDEDSDYVWRENEPIEDSFYSIDEFRDFAEKYDLKFVYISVSYKLE